jgi:hypothetical protein
MQILYMQLSGIVSGCVSTSWTKLSSNSYVPAPFSYLHLPQSNLNSRVSFVYGEYITTISPDSFATNRDTSAKVHS